jgi:hypothetical protein
VLTEPFVLRGEVCLTLVPERPRPRQAHLHFELGPRLTSDRSHVLFGDQPP